jgi:protein gp37
MGCANCYAIPLAERMKFDGVNKYSGGFKLTLHPGQLTRKFDGLKPSRIFVNSMSDLFHTDVPLEFIQQVFAVIAANPRHLFLVLTKRAEVMYKYKDELIWPKNLLMGVTVEHSDYKYRIDLLRDTKAIYKVIFFEPLLDEIGEVDLTGIHWAFVGGESGPNFRGVKPAWVRSLKEQCDLQGCPFVFKQWGGNPRERYGCRLDGKFYDDMPTIENCLW